MDESLLFFSDHETRRRFVDLVIEANIKSTKRIYTLIAAQSFYNFGGLYSTELAANFTEYTLLRTSDTEPFFSLQGVDTAQIDKGVKYSMFRSSPLRPSSGIRDKFLISSGQIKFPARINHPASRFAHFSLLVIPLLITSFLFYYNAPSLNWFLVGNGKHPIPQKIFDLRFILMSLLGVLHYFVSFILFLNAVGEITILFWYNDEKRISYFNSQLYKSIFNYFIYLAGLVVLQILLGMEYQTPPYYPVGVN